MIDSFKTTQTKNPKITSWDFFLIFFPKIIILFLKQNNYPFRNVPPALLSIYCISKSKKKQ
jgi:hypothetical protein